MPPRRTLFDDDEDFPMAGAGAGALARAAAAAQAADPIALDFGAPPETLFQQLVRHWLNERHAPDILPVQAEVLGALLDHIRRQVGAAPIFPYFSRLFFLSKFELGWVFFADGYGAGAAWGSRLVRGGARADHARTD